MKQNEFPVYIINGFLEAGKTSFIKNTTQDPGFANGEKILLILCEEGEEEFNQSECNKKNIEIVTVEEESKFTTEFLENCMDFYDPEKIVIELNGMWDMGRLMELDMPEGWVVVQQITVIDTSTYSNYMTNMRSMMVEQFRYSDTVLFNRIGANVKKLDLRKSVKAVNRKAQLIYETIDGVVDDQEEEVPFDFDAPIIDISEDDFGLWYIDAMDYPKKYEGKTVKFKGMMYKDNKKKKSTFVPGRFAMTCCADDVAFIGFLCKAEKEDLVRFENRSWVEVTAVVKLEYHKEYRGKGPSLKAIQIEAADPPEEEMVYFS